MKEVWKDIDGYNGLYQVSNYGRIKSLKYYGGIKERILKPFKDGNGYLEVCFCKNGKQKHPHIHRLVALHFIPNEDLSKTEINHKDENKENNNINNLEWVDHKTNTNYGTRNERMVKSNKINGCYYKIANLKSKKINQFDLNGNFIQSWYSTREIERETGFKHSNISACCKHKLKTAYGFRWEYSENEQE